MKTMSLKALANKVLQRNSQGNLKETEKEKERNFMSDKYKELTAWLHEFDLTGEEIKQTMPELYQSIQHEIERLDSAFLNEDLSDFQEALNKIKKLYQEAIDVQTQDR